MEVRWERADMACTVGSGLATALEYDGVAGYNPFVDFVRREGQ
jgi:hypothetical protein